MPETPVFAERPAVVRLLARGFAGLLLAAGVALTDWLVAGAAGLLARAAQPGRGPLSRRTELRARPADTHADWAPGKSIDRFAYRA